MKVPDAPGSISAFFLYSDVSGGNDEIDIEIYNDGSRQALLTAWVAGRMERNTTVILPFDPAAGYHDYTIRWSARDLVLLADGARLARWTSGFPRQPMRVMANVWWPTWLSCVPVPAGRELSIERIRLAPITPPEH
jgi:beta-glucanase (GH16 family)